MNLDDAIIYAEDMARINEVEAKVHKAKGHIVSEYTCIGVAEHHRQVAEWLRKLKAYESDEEICKYCTHTHDLDYCNMCKHNTILVDYFDLEVNVDEDSD